MVGNVPTDPRDDFGAAAAEHLLTRGIAAERGMTEQELVAVESRWGFRFPADLRSFLSILLPTDDGWVDWRHGDPDDLARRVSWPLEGMLFDVEQGSFWPEEWGSKPDLPSAAGAIAREQFASWTPLVPIFSHRFMPVGGPGAPVFSVYQTDVIVYGSNLLHYFVQEFGGGIDAPKRWAPVHTPLPTTGYEPWLAVIDTWGSD